MAFAVVYTPEPTRPSGGPRAGTKTLLGWIVSPSGWDAADAFDDTDPTNLGIYNPRDVCGNQWPNWKCKGSQHARGAAGDAGFPVLRPQGHPEGHKLAAWLVKNHVALGIQEVIWAGRRWTNQTQEWRAYSGRSDHFDHVHFAQTDAAADRLTLQMILAVAPHATPTPTPVPVPTPAPTDEEDDDMQLPATLVKGDAKAPWFVTDGVTKQWVQNRVHATLLVNQGVARAATGDGVMAHPELTAPHVWPQAAVDSIRLVGATPPG